MARTLFRSTSFTLRHLVDNINRGDIALPELQRPFVWSNSKVRDLFDSMYRGFPVGYLLFWETGVEVGARQIGVDDKDARVARWLIVDGQQRLTSLYSVLTGEVVVRQDYSESRVRLAFRPRDEHFAVADAAIEKNPEFLPDVTELWRDYRSTVTGYFNRLETARGDQATPNRNELEDAFDRVRDLQNYPFNVVELDSAVQEEQVAEVFVRINSEGVTLNQADFIITLMSVFWEKGRRQLEDFARGCKVPSLSGASAFNWFIAPQPDQMLRVSIALAFRRAVLKHAYSVLRGKDLETGETSTERRNEQFARLQAAQEKVLDLTNWHEFIRCLERAGYRGSKMVSSQNAILYSYAVWLLGRVDYGVPLDQLREVIARWFFMAHTTSRYSGSFESQVEKDFAAIAEVASRDADGFVNALNRIVDDILTADFWAITLPNELATSAARSPALFAYMSALNILDADALLSTGKVRERLDPAIVAKKGIERHHLFPRAYLRTRLGVTDNRQINQIANMAFVEWNDNIAISDKPPAEYWPEQLSSKPHLGPDRMNRQVELHALPAGWTELPFNEFLAQRRRLMADVVRQAFQMLSRSDYDPQYPSVTTLEPEPLPFGGDSVGARVRIMDLFQAGLLPAGTVLTPAKEDIDGVAEIDEEGRIVYGEVAYDTPSAAAVAVTGATPNGWTFWLADTPQGQRRLDSLRSEYQSADIEEAGT
ncbi:GmrSD restriction endonuclease domain-containing protein [Kribbella sp. CA-253562]|uniref:GmrSD restriction endonuclease domain-containing protein n=1 Tax=Kribbella sp. CA-253562 TaxID=3239942 RepID=UPI003D8C6799